MKITSMDINGKEFKKSFRGYDEDEVDEFLDRIAHDYEELYKENSFLKEKLEGLKEQVNHYKNMEENIQNTLLLAQNAAEQARQSAQKEADLIVKSANDSAQKILDKAHNDVIKINDEYQTTKQSFVVFRSKFKNFMKTQMEMFNSMEKDFLKNYNIGREIEDDLNPKGIEINDNVEETEENDEKENIESLESLDSKEDDKELNPALDEIKNFFVEE